MPALVEHGRRLIPQAHFYADEACLARRYDLVLASSSLQYSEDWRGTLGILAQCVNDYLFVTRLPVVQHVPAYVLLQRPYHYGYNTEYLGWCLNQSDLLSAAAAVGLELVREFVIGERHEVRGAPEPHEHRGFLFRRARGAA